MANRRNAGVRCLRLLAGKLLNLVGLQRRVHSRWTMEEGIKLSRQLFAEPDTIVDLGAGCGNWSDLTRRYFRNAHILMCEPLPDRKPILEEKCRDDSNRSYSHCVVGPEDGESVFNRTDDLDGSGVYGESTSGACVLPMRTLDSIIREEQLGGSFWVKFDTHGFEIPILKGMRDTLGSTELIIMEVCVYEGTATAKAFWRMCNHLEDLGFRPFYMVDPMNRPLDGTLWQMDFFFARSDSSIFQNSGHSA